MPTPILAIRLNSVAQGKVKATADRFGLSKSAALTLLLHAGFEALSVKPVTPPKAKVLPAHVAPEKSEPNSPNSDLWGSGKAQKSLDE